jgi:6-phosphogluconolactonase
MSHAVVPRTRVFGIALALAVAVFAVLAGGAMASSGGNVYTMTNSAAGNEVKVFDRAGNGSLTPDDEFATGGSGTGGGLGNQSGLALDGKHLFAVNAGSDSISAFEVKRNGLDLVDTDASGGDQPISLTVHRGLLYVLNAGGTANISGFTVSKSGHLSPLTRSTRPLSAAAPGPAQVSFDPRGELLVVTEKDTNLIDTYEVGRSGRPGVIEPQASAGQTPFGFAFDRRGHLIVSEAFGSATDASAVSSYEIDDGLIDPISPSVGTTETAACWIVVTDNGRFTYTTNTQSASISGYRISREGELDLLDADGVTGQTGANPIDMALSRGSKFLYSLNSGDGTISGFRVGHDGGLTSIGGASGLPDGANGLAAR